MRSNVARRIRVRLPARATGRSPSFSRRAMTKRSIAVLVHRGLETEGGAGLAIGWNAQKERCSGVIAYSDVLAAVLSAGGQYAPRFTHSVRTAICSAASFPDGGMRR